MNQMGPDTVAPRAKTAILSVIGICMADYLRASLRRFNQIPIPVVLRAFDLTPPMERMDPYLGQFDSRKPARKRQNVEVIQQSRDDDHIAADGYPLGTRSRKASVAWLRSWRTLMSKTPTAALAALTLGKCVPLSPAQRINRHRLRARTSPVAIDVGHSVRNHRRPGGGRYGWVRSRHARSYGWHAVSQMRGPQHAYYDWSLTPYHVPQATDSACSLASITMLVNALRGLGAPDDPEEVTQDEVLRAVASEEWTSQTVQGGSGVSFAAFSHYVRLSLDAFQIDADIEVLKPCDRSETTFQKLRRMLTPNERNDQDIVLAYFNQGVLVGSWDGPHISPIGAYDARDGQVLMMDVDRNWRKPYWASDQKLLEAMLRPSPEDQGVLVGETGGLVRAILKSPVQ
jgi:hypothetical protein